MPDTEPDPPPADGVAGSPTPAGSLPGGPVPLVPGLGGLAAGGPGHPARNPRVRFDLAGANRDNRVAAVLVVVAVVGLGVLWALGAVHRFALLYLAVLVPSIILHEIAHGVVAYALGDDTAKRAGRLTLNPVPHVEPFGTVVLPALLLAVGSVGFGWARPVPVRVDRLRSPRNGHVLVALAGPLTNFALCALCAFVYLALSPAVFPDQLVGDGGPIVPQLLFLGGLANAYLGLFNLLPIPPLDGSALVERAIPSRYLAGYAQWRQMGMAVLILVIFMVPQVRAGLLQAALHLWDRLSTP